MIIGLDKYTHTSVVPPCIAMSLKQPPSGGPSHYVAFHTVTSGLNGPDLGSDESEIVILLFVVIDAKTKKVGQKCTK